MLHLCVLEYCIPIRIISHRAPIWVDSKEKIAFGAYTYEFILELLNKLENTISREIKICPEIK